MDEKEKLYLMLEEYRSVRKEELERLRLQYQLYATAVAVSAAVFVIGLYGGIPRTAIVMILAVAVLLAIPMALLQKEILAACDRARAIEREINTRTGERLFSRETDRLAIPDHRSIRGRFNHVRIRTKEHSDRWRRGFSQLRNTVRGRES